MPPAAPDQTPRPLAGFHANDSRLISLQINDVRVPGAAVAQVIDALRALPRGAQDEQLYQSVQPGWQSSDNLATTLAAYGLFARRHRNGDVSVEGITGDYVTPTDLAAIEVLAPHLPPQANVVLAAGFDRCPRYAITFTSSRPAVTCDVDVSYTV